MVSGWSPGNLARLLPAAFFFGALGHRAETIVGFFAPDVLGRSSVHPLGLLLFEPACRAVPVARFHHHCIDARCRAADLSDCETPAQCQDQDEAAVDICGQARSKEGLPASQCRPVAASPHGGPHAPPAKPSPRLGQQGRRDPMTGSTALRSFNRTSGTRSAHIPDPEQV